MAYERYVPEFTDKNGQVYGVMDAEAREEVSELNSALDDLNENHEVRSYMDFDWNYGYIDYSGNIHTDNEGYSYSRLISSTEFFAMKITTQSSIEVWAYNADGSYFGKRSNIPANSTEFTPTSGWLSTATQCRLVVVTSKKEKVSAYIPVELATKEQLTAVADDVSDLETSVEGVSDRTTGIETVVDDLQDDLVVHHKLDFDWNYGYIDYSGNIHTDNEEYSYSRLISSTEFFAMKITTQSSIEVWAYNADGSYFGKRSNIPANSTDFTPSAGWLSSATQCRFVILSTKKTNVIASSATVMASKEYVDNSLSMYYNGEVSVTFIIENPMYCKRYTGNRLTDTEDGTLEGAWIKFDKITVQGLLGTKTKTWNEFKGDLVNDHYYAFGKADDFTNDALRISPEACVLYNYRTNEFHYFSKYYFSLHTFTRDETLLFTCDALSNPSGLLYLYWLGTEKGINRYRRAISKNEAKLLEYTNQFVFAFSTDCHFYWDNTGYRNYNNDMVKELKTAIGYDCYINAGDSVFNGTHYKSNGVHSLTRVFDVPVDNFVYSIGNHDYNNTALQETQNKSFMFDADAIESLIYRKLQNIERPNGVRYYYRDFADKKTRVISLDTMDVPIAFDDNGDLTTPNPGITYVIQQDQIDWLCNVLDCPSNDWAVIIVMHVGLYSENEGFSLNSPLTNRASVKAVLSAYVNKTTYNYLETSTYPVSGSGTFANAKGHLVGVWSGHAHVDDYVNTDGFNAIQTQSGYPDTNERIVGTIDEICVDCCCIDMENKKVKLTRFGPGADREYTFE